MKYQVGEALVALSFIFLPLILGWGIARVKKVNLIASLFNAYLFIGVGVQGLATALSQIFFPQVVTTITEWSPSFLMELGMANFSYGVLGVMSLWRGREWKIATGVGYGLFLLITGFGHVYHILQLGLTKGDAGFFLFSDLLDAFALLLLAYLTRKEFKTSTV